MVFLHVKPCTWVCGVDVSDETCYLFFKENFRVDAYGFSETLVFICRNTRLLTQNNLYMDTTRVMTSKSSYTLV